MKDCIRILYEGGLLMSEETEKSVSEASNSHSSIDQSHDEINSRRKSSSDQQALKALYKQYSMKPRLRKRSNRAMNVNEPGWEGMTKQGKQSASKFSQGLTLKVV